MTILIQVGFFSSVLLFIFGLKRMSSPKTASNGIFWAGFGMLLAVLITFLLPNMHNYWLIIIAIVVGSILAWVTGKKVAMTSMPQMVALYNGMGGGSAAAIGAIALLGVVDNDLLPVDAVTLAVVGSIIGAISFSGSLIAFAKLQGWMDKQFVFKGQHIVNLLFLLITIGLGIFIIINPNQNALYWFFALSLVLGVLMTLPIGGADMPVVISLYNAFTGLAVAFEGYVLMQEGLLSGNSGIVSGGIVLIISGTVVGAAGTMLTQLMAKAMNRSLFNVLFGNFGSSSTTASDSDIKGALKPIESNDVAVMMAYANQVVIVPGYGLAVAQAQHKVWELTQQLLKRKVTVKFAIHPVAGRMPGHMNVLLAEASVPYDYIVDLEDINPEFTQTDVVLVIGANDVVNPSAKTDSSSPIYGMPILEVDKAKNVVVIKRGKGTGFSGVENTLFFADNTRMLYGDGKAMVNELVQAIKEL